MDEFGQGLTLSMIGILITFSALGLLILLILALKVLFPERGDDQDTSHSNLGQVSGLVTDREELRKKAAVAGVVILLNRRSNLMKGKLGSELEKPVGNWWQRGLDRIHNKEGL